MRQNEFPQTLSEREEWLNSRIEACRDASIRLEQLNASVSNIREKINNYPSLKGARRSTRVILE